MINILTGFLNKDTVIKYTPGIYHKFKAWLNRELIRFDKEIETKWEDYAGGAMDSVDSRDIKFSEIAGDEIELELPERFELKNEQTLNQGPTNLCVAYGSTEGVNEGNYFFSEAKILDPLITTEYIEKNLDAKIREKGTWIINGAKALKAIGEIYSYFQVDTVREIKQSIYLGCAVQSGTNKLSWSKTGKNGVAVMQSGGGHHMNIVGYDDNLTRADGYGKVYTGFLIIENTWGDKWGDEGRYYLPYELALKVLFNTKKGLIVDKEKVSKRGATLIENMDKKLDEINVINSDNRYYHLLKPYIDKGHKTKFNDLLEKGTINAGEIKTLIELYNVR